MSAPFYLKKKKRWGPPSASAYWNLAVAGEFGIFPNMPLALYRKLTINV